MYKYPGTDGWTVKSMPSFACKDLGMDCPFTANAPTEAELMKKIAEHAKSAHKIDPVPADLAAKIKKAIKK
jgi:predicted small metal-binding protein